LQLVVAVFHNTATVYRQLSTANCYDQTRRAIQQVVVFINSAVPLTLLLWDWSQHQLGANPLEYVTHTTGTLTLLFLCLSLAVTPLRKALGLPWLIQWRRMLGLFAFFYGCLHLLAYTWFDKFFAFGAIVQDVLKRPYIAIGMFGWLVMVPLAVTSTNAMVKRPGREALESVASAGLCGGDSGRSALLHAG
jgi:sulfoxide reductase heme-binding subunit YedZ